ncbi:MULTISPECIES: circularly permuted type 2 ATP-grasp protein [unclassified Rhizobacter]|uniref:circularly permuted type 2 ATP-grasp protein n=1 Tax=unclassified Rhizobacter TaxID=2640088 RepID=UPI0006F343A8|nr:MULTISPECIES: circularly permuted type 2 ATP-grasp protein [unclassified Rhizobacter]KQU80793.1 molybdopterin oxidoreductase [Rhizobacter sp. Root29]KQW04336.1 molybdopterin oxidoreductase [Rhizobacter sp. Root1238]KRB14532.1 molybdopterin oxidoreductase [Rhizobacter sp. Root16D2]
MLRTLLEGYAVHEGRYDELLAAAGEPRPHWEAFLKTLAQRQGPDIGDTLSLMEREIRENGITYNVYADPQGADRPWEVDPLPLLISPAEWDEIEAGIAQRAELLNRVLTDLYGPQELLRNGSVPPSVVFGHSGFLHQVQGIRPAGGVHLFQYAADLARSPDGRWWVVNDRTQAPSGAGYALENRLVVSRVFPQMFRDLHVQHLASFFSNLRESLLRLAPKGDGPPLIGLLTPGPYNETYFEHALLARYLGFALVEGSDLTVRDGRVWMKTVDGLKRVHALLRRQDDDYCDPLELRSDSALGVAGLTDCARRGTVLLANALGSGVLESGALLGYLPQLSEQLLGEPLLLPSVATWWLGEPAAFDDAWKRIDHLIIKPLDRSAGEPAVFGADLSADERLLLRARVAARPQRYVAQEWVHVSQAPVLEREQRAQGAAARHSEHLSARTVGLRVFAVATPNGYRVMPGGLTRVAGDEDDRVIGMQRGGRSKDTWVLSDRPVNASFSLLTRTVTPTDLATTKGNVPSRTAENLFWFGRYGERCDASARLLRVAVAGVLGNVDARADDPEDGLTPTLALARRMGLIDASDDVGTELLRAATHPDEGLSMRLRQLLRVAFSLRDRMSADNWRTLNQLIADPVFQRGGSLALALAWLDRAVTSMMTLSGFVLDGMTRSTSWRFLSIGRRIERLSTLCQTLKVATREGRSSGLDWLLELTDSTVTFRSRYLVAPEWLPVLDLLLRDDTNPRSVAFQVKGLVEYVEKLERTHGRFASDVLGPAQAALLALGAHDLHPESEALAAVIDQLQRAAYTVSDELTLKFFSHAASRSVLSLVA